jgi:hypothetical protein
VITVACYSADRAAIRFLRRCERVAGTLRLKRAKAFGLGPSRRYGKALRTTLGSLPGTTKLERESLVTVDEDEALADAAETVAASFADARKTLERASVSPLDGDVHTQLVGALGALRSAFRDMADAARAGRPGEYRKAAARARRAARSLEELRARLATHGYLVDRPKTR